MANSDVDSWYEWKQDNFIEHAHQNGLEKVQDYELPDISRYDRLPYKEAQENTHINEWITSYDDDIAGSQAASDVRFVNPAIYVESLENEAEAEEEKIITNPNPTIDDLKRNAVGADCGDSCRINDLLSKLSVNDEILASSNSGDQSSSQATYRCHSVASSVTPSIDSSCESSALSSSSKLTVRRRCRIGDALESKDDTCSARQDGLEVQRYTLNGHRVIQMSTTTSSSCTSIPRQTVNGNELARKISHEEWVRKKQEEAQRKREEEELLERQKRMEEERFAREKEERELRERENFLKWVERKKREEEERKAAIEKELKLQKRFKELEDQAAVAKTLCVRRWSLKKKKEEKSRQEKLELKRKQVDEERRKRLADSSKAYEKWRESSKNKPRPATQGLLPHQKAKPAYVNPTPWQSIVDDDGPAQENESSFKRTK